MANPLRRPSSDDINASAPKQPRIHRGKQRIINEIYDLAAQIAIIMDQANHFVTLYNRTQQLIYRCYFNSRNQIIEVRLQYLQRLHDELNAAIANTPGTSRSIANEDLSFRADNLCDDIFQFFDQHRLRFGFSI